MSYTHLIVEIGQCFVATLTLNRPDQLKIFNGLLAEELTRALMAMDSDPLVRVVIIKGADKVFCAGIDITELADKTAMEYQAWIEHMERWWQFPA